MNILKDIGQTALSILAAAYCVYVACSFIAFLCVLGYTIAVGGKSQLGDLAGPFDTIVYICAGGIVSFALLGIAYGMGNKGQ